MLKKDFNFYTKDELKISVSSWLPDKVKAVVQIAHGMAEYKDRYSSFADFLVDRGFAVYINDHRGHGSTAGSIDKLGFFATEDGWFKVVDDMCVLTDIIKKEHPQVPIFLLGHSMGSLLCRTYIMKYGKGIKGVILSGTGGDPGFKGLIGLLFVKNEIWKKGRKAKSPKLNSLFFKNYNKFFKPNRTEFDWLSRDKEIVDKYIADPFCGTKFTTGFFLDLLTGVRYVSNKNNIDHIPKDLPIYLFSGSLDPVGENTKGVKNVYRSFKKAGIKDLTLKIYKNGRHEMLNELNKEEVYEDILVWLESSLTS